MLGCGMRLSFIGAGALLVFPPLASLQAAPAVPAPAGEWMLNQDEHSCSIVTKMAGAGRQTLTIGVGPAQEGAEGSLAGNFPRLAAQFRQIKVDIVLLPTSFRATALAAVTMDPGNWQDILQFWDLPEMFVDQFSQSSGLAIEAKGKRRFQAQYSNPAKAVSELQACNEMLMRRWGLNAVAIAALKRKPKLVPGVALIKPHDYPATSLQRGEQGTTVVRYIVDRDGRAKNCILVVSSGFKAIDIQSCKSLLARGRFEPALDALGNTVAAETVSVFKWAIGR